MPNGRQQAKKGVTAPPVLFIVGPTAVGKSRLAVALARRFNGEIVNADSRQVYRHMDIGTAKPLAEQRTQAPHHLLEMLNPDQDFGLASFLSLAEGSIRDIHGRGHLPIVTGGTGQYIWALVEGWQVPQVPPDPVFRQEMQREAEQYGSPFVYQQLQEVDPERAAQLDPSNLRRVIRALEVHRAGPHACQLRSHNTTTLKNELIIGLTMERVDLYQRIDERVDGMLASGLLEEVKGLAARGYRLGQGPLSSPGYRELGQYLDGQCSLDEAVQRTKYQTHRLVRRQYAWFKLRDTRIHWLNAAAPDLESRAALVAQDFLSALPAVVQ